MAFQLGDDEMQGLSEMNLIPLIDIMLVLMIIFMVTASVLNPSIPLDLPNTVASIQQQPPVVIEVAVDKQASIFWGEEPISIKVLETRFKAQSQLAEPPTIQLRVDKEARYETVAQILGLAGKSNLTKIAFVSE